MRKKWISFIAAAAMAVTLCACEEEDITDQVKNVAQAEDEHILGVKGATPDAYPGKTYGNAFENFFGSPAWKYFVGTKEGSDEDGDGEPDYTEEGIDVVEFTGYCTYQDVEVKARIQFTLDEEAGTFEATYLSFNDVPQSMGMLSALMEAVFTDADMDEIVENSVADDPDEEKQEKESVADEEKQEKESVTDEEKQENAADKEKEQKDTDKEEQDDRYPLLDEFVSLICSFSDPPDLEGDELTEYFKGEYDKWSSGESYANIIKDSDGHLVIPDHRADYVGHWWDTYSERCNMEINSSDGIYYTIDINWSSGATDNTHWSFYGTYDEMANGIHYSGSRIEEYYSDSGDVQETYVYDNGDGLIWMGDDGMLYWDDNVEGQGANCSFERSEY